MYKRQIQIGEKDQQFKKLYAEILEIKAIAVDQKKKVEELNKNSNKKPAPVAVSYTHLDVYKRQAVCPMPSSSV